MNQESKTKIEASIYVNSDDIDVEFLIRSGGLKTKIFISNIEDVNGDYSTSIEIWEKFAENMEKGNKYMLYRRSIWTLESNERNIIFELATSGIESFENVVIKIDREDNKKYMCGIIRGMVKELKKKKKVKKEIK